MRVLLLAAVLLTACAPAAPAAPAQPPTSTATARPVPTAAPTSTPAPDYNALRTELLTPLAAYIVATRDRSASAANWRSQFNAAADNVLPKIERDVSTNGNVLHSVITNVKEAMARDDLATIERERTRLITEVK